MFRVLVLLVLLSLGWVAVCGCVGGESKPPSLQPSGVLRGGGVRRRDPRPAPHRLRLLRGLAGGASAPAGPERGREREGLGAVLGGDARRRALRQVEALRRGQDPRPAAAARRALRPGRRLHPARPRDPRADGGNRNHKGHEGHKGWHDGMKPRMARMVADYWSATADRTARMFDDEKGIRI